MTRKTRTEDLSANSNTEDDLETPLSPANPHETTSETITHYMDAKPTITGALVVYTPQTTSKEPSPNMTCNAK